MDVAELVFWDGLQGSEVLTCFPNPRRTLQVIAPGYAGVFTAMTADTDDVATFDLTDWLASLGNPGEAITSMTLDLTVTNRDGTTDPAPNARQTGIITVTSVYASQRFGNFQPDIDYIQYCVKAAAKTNLNNSIAFWGYLPVDAPIA